MFFLLKQLLVISAFILAFQVILYMIIWKNSLGLNVIVSPNMATMKSNVGSPKMKLHSFSSIKDEKKNMENKKSYRDFIDTFEILQGNVPFHVPEIKGWTQGFPIQYTEEEFSKGEILEVFLTAHSHMDFGWIKTPEEYFRHSTVHIINSVVDQLALEPDFRFSFAEVAFLAMWLDQADSKRKDIFFSAVADGRIEIVHGGWVMPDEGCTHFYNLIDQMTTGHQYLNSTFPSGVKIQTSWSVDPFGLSSTLAQLNKLAGMKYSLLHRVHYSVKRHLAQGKNLEFYWKQYGDNSNFTNILTHVMPFFSYDVPHTCGPDPSICCEFDFELLNRHRCPWKTSKPRRIHTFNVKERSSALLHQYRQKSKLYKTRKLFVPLMDDFRFSSTVGVQNQFSNYQMLMNYINHHPELRTKIRWSTPGEYMKAVEHTDEIEEFPILQGDFFVYADKIDEYWSGYFSTRPFVKWLDRITTAQRKTAESLLFFLSHSSYKMDSNLMARYLQDIVTIRKEHAAVQHHDSITGTSRALPTVHLINKMMKNLDDTSILTSSMLEKYLEMMTGLNHRFHMINIKKKDNFGDWEQQEIDSVPSVIVLYNSLQESVTVPVSLIVPSKLLKIVLNDANEENSTIPCQFSPTWFNRNLDDQKTTLTYFSTIPPFSVISYSLVSSPIETCSSTALFRHKNSELFKNYSTLNDSMLDENKFFRISHSRKNYMFDSQTFQIRGFCESYDNNDCVMVNLRTRLEKYLSNNRSGAYLFINNGETPISYNFDDGLIMDGSLFSEVTLFVNSIGRHSIRIWKNKELDEATLHIKNIHDISSESNIEYVLTIESFIENQQLDFYTDVNAFQMHKRRFTKKLPLQGNLYPATSFVYIEDERHRLTVIMDQTHGVTCTNAGYIQIVMDRKLNQDDLRGMYEPLEDNRVTVANMILLIETLRVPSSENTKKSYGFLSTKAGVLNRWFFLSPPLTFQDSGPIPLKQTVTLFKPFHQDQRLEIINFRTNALCFPGDSKSSVRNSQILFLLNHRIPLISNFSDASKIKQSVADEEISSSGVTLNLQDIFRGDWSLYESSITGAKLHQVSGNITLAPGKIFSLALETGC